MTGKRISIIAAVTAVAGLAISCSRRDSSGGTPIRAGSLMDTNIQFAFAIYYLPVPKNNPSAALAKFLSENFTNIQQVAITFHRYKGRDVHAKQTQLLSTLFGWEDAVSTARHDEEILAASRRARQKLPELRAAFDKGLAPGEYIQVKAPFVIPGGGSEWMWVEITAWQRGRIKGLLKNEPRYIPALHGGQMVEVDEAKVFDYVRTFPDGRQEGNETAAIIERQNTR